MQSHAGKDMLLLAIVALLVVNALAQRPEGVSICDYYAQTLYGANSSDAQLTLVQNIVALAFAGGGALKNTSSDLTGILNPGTFSSGTIQDLDVDLRPWFNGSIASTNLYNEGVGINWLDGGGLDPLYGYLNGSTSNVTLPSGTNQYRLFTHFFVSFADLFACSLPPVPPPNRDGSPDETKLSVAYVHKYMNLNFTDIGHFINQLSYSVAHVGFSDQDVQTLDTQLNSQYNVRCAPPIAISPNPTPQLLSLCQASNCPLAQPNSDCQAYVNLTADGVAGSAIPSSIISTATFFGATSTAAPTSATGQITAPAASSNTPTSSSTLSTGAIAGIAIGGAAVLAFVVFGAIFFFRRQKKQNRAAEPRFHPPPSENFTTTTLGYAEPMYSPQVMSPEMRKSNPVAEMESPLSSPRFLRSSAGRMDPVEIGGQDGGQGHWGRR